VLLTLVQCNSLFVPFHIGFLQFLTWHGSVAPVIACPTAKGHAAWIAHAQTCHAANHALDPTVVHDATYHAASQIAHPVVRAAVRAAIGHIATQTAAAIHHAVNQTVALTTICHAANRTAAHVVNRTELLHGPRDILMASA
jgi:hypothetical protein